MNLKQPTPPVFFLFSVFLMYAMNKFVPGFKLNLGSLSYAIGIMFLCFGLAIVLQAISVLKKAKTTVKPWQEPSALVTNGPYSYCRNPIYLGMVIVLFGVFFFMGNSTSLVVVFLFGAVIEDKFIKTEEKTLTKKFGKEYIEYTFKVSKWFPQLSEFTYEKRQKKK